MVPKASIYLFYSFFDIFVTYVLNILHFMHASGIKLQLFFRMDKISFQFIHGGKLISEPSVNYVGGVREKLMHVDPDLMSMLELDDYAIKLRYLAQNCKYYHLLPDSDVLNMFACHVGRKLIHIYIKHLGSDECQVEEDGGSISEGEFAEFSSENEGGKTDSSTDDLEFFSDGDSLIDDDNSDRENVISKYDKPLKIIVSKNVNDKRVTNIGKGKEKCIDETEEDENTDEEEPLMCPKNFAEDAKQEFEFPEFDEKRHMSNPELKLGMLFSNVKVFRAALEMHSIKNGDEFEYKKNEGDRVTIVCKAGCSWRPDSCVRIL